jgi:hypothetical protein
LQFDGYLYRNGAQSEAYPLQSYTYGSGGSVTFNASTISLYTPTSSATPKPVAGVVTAEKIDVTNYSTLTLTNGTCSPRTDITTYFGISSTYPDVNPTEAKATVAGNNASGTLDISSFTGEYYVYAYLQHGASAAQTNNIASIYIN